MAGVWAVIWPLPLLATLLLASKGSRGALLPGFFVLVLLWPITLTTLRFAGPLAGAAAGAICALLLVAQIALAPPALPAEAETLVRFFDLPQQEARHTVRLPTGDPAWQRLWARAPAPSAYFYFMVETKPGVTDPGLVVRLGERQIGTLSPATRYAALENHNDDPVSWFRIPVARDVLEAESPLPIVVAPLASSWPGPGSSGLVGGFSYRPTFSAVASAFGEAGRWVTDPATVLPQSAPSGASRLAPDRGPVRYYVELRIVQPQTGRFLAIFY